MGDYYQDRAEDVYQRLMRGEAVPMQDMNAVYQLVDKKLIDTHQPGLQIYNNGSELFYSLHSPQAVSGGAKHDELAPTPHEEADKQAAWDAKQKEIAERVLNRPIKPDDPVPTAEEIAALKYYALEDKESAAKVRNFVFDYGRNFEDDLSNANISRDQISEKRDYYLDKVRGWNRDEVDANRAQGGDHTKILNDQENCQVNIVGSMVRGHQVAAFLMDMGGGLLNEMQQKYPLAFENAHKLEHYDADGLPKADDSVGKSTAALETSLNNLICKPVR